MCRVLNGPVIGGMGKAVPTTALSPSRRNLCRLRAKGNHLSSFSLLRQWEAWGRNLMTWKCGHVSNVIWLEARHCARCGGGIKMIRIESLLSLQSVADRNTCASTLNTNQSGIEANTKTCGNKGWRGIYSHWESGKVCERAGLVSPWMKGGTVPDENEERSGSHKQSRWPGSPYLSLIVSEDPNSTANSLGGFEEWVHVKYLAAVGTIKSLSCYHGSGQKCTREHFGLQEKITVASCCCFCN